MSVFELEAKINLDKSGYEQGVKDAKGTFSSLASGVGKGLATVAKVGATAIAAGAAGVAALTKMSVEGYAQYEQLVGGVETLFKESSGAVQQFAENAYKTSGMSANQYMETVTSFSASLIQSLDGDTAKAAQVADMAITDMSDNANKMGTSIEMIQNAYNGFAKGNFTMLDNLKLGYGGTQQEMQRLLKDAEAISGIKYDISSFADISEAIHVMQTEMGIAGATANEAATTIEGSIGMMKGAWENLVVGMADSNADMGSLITAFVDSAKTAASNILPVVEQSLVGIGSLIEGLAPMIGEALPKLVESVLPSLLSAGMNLVVALVNGIVKAAPGIYSALMDAIYVALTEVFGMSEESASTFVGTIDGLVQSLVAFFQAGFSAISAAFSWLVGQTQTEGTTFNLVWNNIKTAVSAAIEFIKSAIKLFTSVLKGDWSAAWSAVASMTSSFGTAIGAIIEGILNVVVGFLSAMVEAGFALITSLASGIASKFSEIYTMASGWVTTNIINPIANMGTSLYNAGVNLLNQFWNGLTSVWTSISNWWNGLTLAPKNATVNYNGPGGNNGTGAATGLNYVPYDEFPAILHRGEAVLTAAEARIWRKNGLGGSVVSGGGITINQYIQSVPQTPVDLANATESYFEQARWML